MFSSGPAGWGAGAVSFAAGLTWRDQEFIEGAEPVEVGAAVPLLPEHHVHPVPGLRGGQAAELFRDAAARFVQENGPMEVTLRHEPPEWQSFDESTYRGAAYPTFAWGADVVEVEVDPDTLAVRPVQVTAVCEVGRAIHKTLCAGQI